MAAICCVTNPSRTAAMVRCRVGASIRADANDYACRRLASAVFSPASCSLIIAMSCSSENRAFTCLPFCWAVTIQLRGSFEGAGDWQYWPKRQAFPSQPGHSPRFASRPAEQDKVRIRRSCANVVVGWPFLTPPFFLKGFV